MNVIEGVCDGVCLLTNERQKECKIKYDIYPDSNGHYAVSLGKQKACYKIASQ